MCDYCTCHGVAELLKWHSPGNSDARYGPVEGFREWLPDGWESPYYPLEDDAVILPQWFRWGMQTIWNIEEYQVRSHGDAETLIAVHDLGAMLVRDASRLIQYLIDTRGYRQMPRSAPTVKAVDDLPEVAGYLQDAQAWAEAENKKPRTPLSQKKIAPQFVPLWAWAEENLDGKQQRVMKLVIEHDGECPLLDIAIDGKIDWVTNEVDMAEIGGLFNSIRYEVTKKLKADKQGWELRRRKNNAWLKKVA